MNKRGVGHLKEELAVSFLKQNNIQILERNFSCKIGEIDIIGLDRDCLVFFEVKYRKNATFGYPEEAISKSKIRKISLVSNYFLLKNSNFAECTIRYDVISILGDKISWKKNAFYYNGI